MSASESRAPPPKVDTGATTSYSLQGILSAVKGKVAYKDGEAFLLHVFWETPSLEAARQLLAALNRCAIATHRDTPCVPTYFFRINNNDIPLCEPTPQLVGEHPAIREARKKISIGIAPPAVRSDFQRRGFDVALLDMNDTDLLPEAMRNVQPVTVECTELYLDERAMMEHAGSRDYLDAYGAVMNPQLTRKQPHTVRLGTPSEHLRERMLEPILKEIVEPVQPGCHVWQLVLTAERSTSSDVSSSSWLGMPGSVFLSLDIDGGSNSELSDSKLRSLCTTLMAFPHQLREGTTRLLAVLPQLPSSKELVGILSSLSVARGETHIKADEATVQELRDLLSQAGLSSVLVNASECVGYALHAKAGQLHVE